MKIYVEEQKFAQIWIWILLTTISVGVIGQFVYGLYIQIGKGIPYGDKPMNNAGLILTTLLTTLLMAGILLLFLFAKLTVRIDSKAIIVHFRPFFRKEKNILWSEIESFEVVKYRPIAEFGGWGVRYGRRSMAYNVKGDMGLRLRFRNGKSLLIGTSNAEELSHFLTHLDPLDRKAMP